MLFSNLPHLHYTHTGLALDSFTRRSHGVASNNREARLVFVGWLDRSILDIISAQVDRFGNVKALFISHGLSTMTRSSFSRWAEQQELQMAVCEAIG